MILIYFYMVVLNFCAKCYMKAFELHGFLLFHKAVSCKRYSLFIQI